MALENTKDDIEKQATFARLMAAITESVDETYLEKILQQNIDVNYKIVSPGIIDRNHYDLGSTALHLACKICRQEEDIRKIKLLLKYGADFMIKNNRGANVLHETFWKSRYSRSSNELGQQLDRKPIIDMILDVQIKSGNKSNPRDNDGLSHFHLACVTDNIKALEFFLDNGEDINQQVQICDKLIAGRSPLHFAVCSRNLNAARILLKHGASLQLKDSKGQIPIHLCLKDIIALSNVRHKNNIDNKERIEILDSTKKMMKLLVESCVERNILIVDDFGLTTFHLVCTLGDIVTIESHLKNVENVNHAVKKNSSICPGYTALHFAANFDVKSLIYLFEKGADILVKDANGVSPFDICLKKYSIRDIHSILNSHQEWREILLSDGKTKLIDLILAMRDLKKFKRFIRHRDFKSLTVPNDSSLWPGCTILHMAVILTKTVWDSLSYPQTEAIQINDPSDDENENCSSDDAGSEHENEDDEEENKVDHMNIIKKCLRLGIEVTVQDAHGSSPLHLAFHSGKIEIVGTLLRYHLADKNPVDKHNLSHFHIACAARNVRLVRKLILNGIDIESRVSSTIKWYTIRKSAEGSYYPFFIPTGSSSLHIAVGSRSKIIVSILLKHKADIHAVDEHGMTPIHRTITMDKYRRYATAKLMTRSLKLKNIIVEKVGFSHLHVACCIGDNRAVKRLLDQGVDINAKIVDCKVLGGVDCGSFDYRDPYGDSDFETPYAFLTMFLNYTPYCFAMRNYSSSKTGELLIKRGADLLIKSSYDSTPLYNIFNKWSDGAERMSFVLKKLKNDDVFRENVKERTGMTILHMACRANDIDSVEYGLKIGEDVNDRIPSDSPIFPGCTALHILLGESYFNDKEDVKVQIFDLLCEHGADLSLVDKKNETVIHSHYREEKVLGHENDSHENDKSIQN